MKLLFCNIAWMDHYAGNEDGNDPPYHGGSYVDRTGDAHEKYNFTPVSLREEDTGYPDGEYCLGFVETKSTNGQDANQLKLQSIDDCESLKEEDEADDVTVIYCARYPDSEIHETCVVGWFRHAVVYRNYQCISFENDDGTVYDQYYNAIAKSEDVVLLPRGMRRRNSLWHVPRKKNGISYGFGQSNVWFAKGREDNPYLDRFLTKIVKQIEEYDSQGSEIL